jgi:acetyl-CoA C-acetyltransferase
MTLDQIDLVEINEAFAPVVLAGEGAPPRHEQGERERRRSRSVTRSVVRAPDGDARQRARAQRRPLGPQTMCEGGGMASTTIIERLGYTHPRQARAVRCVS